MQVRHGLRFLKRHFHLEMRKPATDEWLRLIHKKSKWNSASGHDLLSSGPWTCKADGLKHSAHLSQHVQKTQCQSTSQPPLGLPSRSSHTQCGHSCIEVACSLERSSQPSSAPRSCQCVSPAVHSVRSSCTDFE